jgi:tetratricopeptide (TPR) repeat protein
MKKIFFILLAIATINTYSQTLKTKFILAKKYFEAGDYKTAAELFQEIYDRNENTEVAFYLAESYRKIRNYKKADKYYRKVLRYEKEKYPLAYFWEGVVKKHRGDYKRAAIFFKKFYRKFKNYPDKFYITKAKYEKEICDRLKQQGYVQIDSSLSIKRMSPPINLKEYSDYLAQEINDSIFLFSSYRPVIDSIIFPVSLWQICCGNLNKPDTLFLADSTHYPNFYYDKTDSTLYVTICPFTGKCKIGKVKYYEGEILERKIKMLPSVINMPGTNSTQPYVCKIDNTKYLFFASDREGGKGKYDIWYAKIINGEFYDVTNAGDKINSPDDEICPYYDTLTSTLYFSSRWHESLGGFDIFSSYGKPGNWSEPVNPGKPLNSTYDDVFFTISQKSAYFSSNRPENPKEYMCCNDIFSVLLKTNRKKLIAKTRKNITRHSLSQLIPIKLYFDNDQPNPKSYDTTTTLDYLETYQEYLNKKDEFIREYSRGLSGEEKTQAINTIEDFFEDSVVANFNKLQHFMDLLQNLLAEGDTIEITIKGFASPLNKSDYNANLSKRRIQSIVNYLYRYKNGMLSQYINNGQLIIKRIAFGETKANKEVSDKLTDLKHSVYSPEASKERKVEIIAIKF